MAADDDEPRPRRSSPARTGAPVCSSIRVPAVAHRRCMASRWRRSGPRCGRRESGRRWSRPSRTNHPPRCARQAAEGGYSMVIAGGGDGTVGATAKGLVGTECPLGILPMGTYNNFARALGLPQDLRAACRVLARAGCGGWMSGWPTRSTTFSRRRGSASTRSFFRWAKRSSAGTGAGCGRRRNWRTRRSRRGSISSSICRLRKRTARIPGAAVATRRRGGAAVCQRAAARAGFLRVSAHRGERALLRQRVYGRAECGDRRRQIEHPDFPQFQQTRVAPAFLVDQPAAVLLTVRRSIRLRRARSRSRRRPTCRFMSTDGRRGGCRCGSGRCRRHCRCWRRSNEALSTRRR